MQGRPAELHASALSISLSPPEYKAFSTYLQTLTGRSSVTPSSIKSHTTFRRDDIRQIAQGKIGIDAAAAYKVIEAVIPGNRQELTVGQTLACFRLMGHARTAVNRHPTSSTGVQVDLALLFVPCTPPEGNQPAKVPPPVPSRARKTSTNLTSTSQKTTQRTDQSEAPVRGSASRQSLPARFPTNPFYTDFRRVSPEKKSRSKSVAFDDDDEDENVKVSGKLDDLNHSNSNPFRQRQVSVPTILARPPAPPLPPRKAAASASGDSPRRKRVPSVSSATSLISHNTSGPRASTLIQSSLSAAAAQSSSSRRPAPSLHVIQQSTGGSSTGPTTATVTATRTASSSRNADLIKRVSEAVKESEEETPQAPPRRSTSSRSKSRLRHLAKPFLDNDPDLTPWSCVDLVQGIASERPIAMIILNQPITRKDIFLRAWSASTLRLCADGGANRLYDLFNTEQRQSYLPTLIKGDLDSLRSDVREYYASKGVSVLHDGSEYSTDLQKCIEEVEAAEKKDDIEYDLLLMGGLSGRVDQTVHVMSLLHKLRKSRPRTFILSSESLAWVLDEGSHIIEIDHSTMGQTCGILPVGIDSAYVKTEGLKWNLDWDTSFDGDISSSNHLLPSEPLVHIKTDRPILWCIEVKPNLPSLPKKDGAQRQTSIRRSISTSKSNEIPKAIRDLSMGMARAAEGVGRELEKLAVRDTRPAVDHDKPKEDSVALLDDRDDSPPPRSTDRLREEAGWSRLD